MSPFLTALAAAHPYVLKLAMLFALLAVCTSPVARTTARRVGRRVRREAIEFVDETTETIAALTGRVSG